MDIHNKEFKSKGRNGYDRYEVDSFLDEIVDNYGDALDQIVDLKNEVVSLNSKIKICKLKLMNTMTRRNQSISLLFLLNKMQMK